MRLPDLDIAHSTPKGLRRPAQGCRPRLPWGQAVSVSNPEGVASSSPGLPSAATLGPGGFGFQPRRGCVLIPTDSVRPNRRCVFPASSEVPLENPPFDDGIPESQYS